MGRATPSVRAVLAAFILSFGVVGCRAVAFDRAWRRPAANPAAVEPGKGSDRWEGTWHSQGTGHSGRLRAIADRRPGTSEATAYVVRFDAVWGGVFRFGETVTVRLTDLRTGGPTVAPGADARLKGTHDAGWLGGGVYDFEGTLTDARFDLTYTSQYDHGYFEMTPAAVKAK